MTHDPARAEDGNVTIEEFARMPEEDAYRVELVRGRLVREPRPAPLHGRVLSRLDRRLGAHVDEAGLGDVLVDVGFVLSDVEQTVRGPDLAFVSRDRLSDDAYDEQGFWRFPPDLAVEVVSPSNSASEIQQKVLEYLDAGTRLVWVVYPRGRRVTVHHPGGEARVLGADDELDGADVVPGFRVRVSELFPT